MEANVRRVIGAMRAAVLLQRVVVDPAVAVAVVHVVVVVAEDGEQEIEKNRD